VTLGSGFIAGTPVRTPDGRRPIEQLQAGDLVLTRLDDGRTAARRISRTAVHPDLEVLYVGYRVQGGAGASESLTSVSGRTGWLDGSGAAAAVVRTDRPPEPGGRLG
jgi:hypothetical protein